MLITILLELDSLLSLFELIIYENLYLYTYFICSDDKAFRFFIESTENLRELFIKDPMTLLPTLSDDHVSIK